MIISESQEYKNSIIKMIVPFCEGMSIQDLIDLAKNTSTLRSSFNTANKLYSGSIMKRTAQLVLTFPVIVSSFINVNTAILISKAIERKCVNLLKILFAAVNLASYKDTKDLHDYISKFHTNLGVSSSMLSLDDFITMADNINRTRHENCYDDSKEMYKEIIREMKYLDNEAITTFNSQSINEYEVIKDGYGRKSVYIKEDSDSDKNKSKEKANELMPSIMTVEFTTIGPDGSIIKSDKGVIGIKAKLYPINGLEIRNRLTDQVNDTRGLFGFIRASTGEISFWRDLVFAFDRIKREAIAVAKGSETEKLFTMLKARANVNNSRFNTTNANPITTLVITQDEVEALKKNNIDVTNPKISNTIMNNFNLMGLVIVDDSTETAKFLFDDGSDNFETLSYTALTKENKEQSTLNKVANIIQKGGIV